MDRTKHPPIYFRILKSRLVSQKNLDQVYEELQKKLEQLHHSEKSHSKSPSLNQNSASDEISDKETGFVLQDPSLLEDPHQDKTDFELGIPLNNQDSASMEFSDASREISLYLDSPYEEEMERFLPAELELRGFINRWQVSQLLHSRTRFTLGQYRIIDSLGVGGYGHVFLARPVSDSCNLRPNQCRHPHKNDVAVKVLPLAQSNETTIIKFLREVELNRFIRHPNIARFIESAHDANVHYSVYEYVNGGDIRRLITRFERLDHEAAASIISQTAQGLQALHNTGLVHRDIKPGNILITRDGVVKLTDMGLAIPFADAHLLNNGRLMETVHSFDEKLKAIDEQKSEGIHSEDQKPKKRKVAGTPDYIAPDQIRDSEHPSPLWDIYSLGCTFYFMITGIVPFPAGTAQQKIQAQLYCDPPEPLMFNSQIPGELSRFIVQMMDKSPESRIQSAKEVIDFLAPWTLSPSKLAFRLLDRKTDSGDSGSASLLNTVYSDNDDSFLRKAFESEEDPVQKREIGQNRGRGLHNLIPPPVLPKGLSEEDLIKKDLALSHLEEMGPEIDSLEQWAVFLSFYILIPLLLLAILIMFFYLSSL
ncbi:MAG: serine/threonine-protein kinase [Planctomycetia bacterium]|nr:serine/threonine-protein kinase [Planctomycetia bacterium]